MQKQGSVGVVAVAFLVLLVKHGNRGGGAAVSGESGGEGWWWRFVRAAVGQAVAVMTVGFGLFPAGVCADDELYLELLSKGPTKDTTTTLKTPISFLTDL